MNKPPIKPVSLEELTRIMCESIDRMTDKEKAVLRQHIYETRSTFRLRCDG